MKTAGTTLHGQLMRVMAVIFALAFGGVGAVHWNSTRAYLEQQLASHAQDAASSLALALSTTLQGEDLSQAEVTVMSLFDRGYYRSLTVRATDGTVLLERRLEPRELIDVPAWFRSLADLQPPLKQAVVSAGWRQVGHVEVVSEPRFAYRQLWASTLQTAIWMVLIFVLSWLAARIWLRTLLVPMRQLEQAAQDVSMRRFRKLTFSPRTIELQRLVSGFNGLIDAVQSLLGYEEQRAERFRSESLTDELTGMLNRKGLAGLVAEGIPDHAWIGIIECGDLERINQELGGEAGNELIRLLAQTIWNSFPDGTAIRLSAAGFAVLLREPVPSGDIHIRCRSCLEAATQVCADVAAGMQISAGWAQKSQRDLRSWLAAADAALSRTEPFPQQRCSVSEEESGVTNPVALAQEEWIRVIRQSLEHKRVRLAALPTLPSEPVENRQVLHHELLAVLLDEEGNELAASRWMDVAARYGLLMNLDRIVLERLADVVSALEGQVAINLSIDSWSDQRFVQRLPCLRQELKQWPQLVFEIREEDAVRCRHTAALFVKSAREAGFGIALDKFGVVAGGIAVLQELLPDYIKLDASVVAQVSTESGRFYLESLASIARTLDIRVFALSFGQDDLSEQLQRLGITGIQGHAVAARTILADNTTGCTHD